MAMTPNYFSLKKNNYYPIFDINTLNQNPEIFPETKPLPKLEVVTSPSTTPDKIPLSRKLYLNLNQTQKEILREWNEARIKTINHCISILNNYYYCSRKEEFSYIFSDWKFLFQRIKDDGFFDVNNLNICPDKVRKGFILDFSTNLKSALTQLKNGTIKHFKFKKLTENSNGNFLAVKEAIGKTGIYSQYLKKIKDYQDLYQKITTSYPDFADSRLVYDKVKKKYYLSLVYYYTPTNENLQDRTDIIALDPGMKTFQVGYSRKGNESFTLPNINKRIRGRYEHLRTLQSRLSKNVGKDGERLKRKRGLKNKIKRVNRKIENGIRELHIQTSLKLTKENETIIIPTFETKNMVQKKNVSKEIVTKRRREMNLPELKNYSRQNKLRRFNAFLMMRLAHHRFRENYLKTQCKKRKCSLLLTTEEYTSQCCGRCGLCSSKYEHRIKVCSNCGLRIDRDVNGSRNIYVKSTYLTSHDDELPF